MSVKPIVTPFFRLSHPNVFKARSVKGSAPKFGIQMIFIDQALVYTGHYRSMIVAPDGSDPSTWTDLQKDYATDPTLCIQMRRLLVDAMKESWGDDKSKWAAPFNVVDLRTYTSEDGKRWPIRDGNLSGKPEYLGYLYAGAKSNEDRQPGIARRDPKDKRPIQVSEVYGGLICRAEVNAFAWTNELGGKGVSFGLNHLQIIKDDGVRYGASSGPVEEAFGAWDADGDMDPANYPSQGGNGVAKADDF